MIKKFMEYLEDVEKETIEENATFGATNASNVAVCIGGLNGQVAGLGLGFDEDYSRSFYPPPKKKKKEKRKGNCY